MHFYSVEMIFVGIILLGGMAAGGIKICLTKKQAYLEPIDLKND
jgi:hypothetical protein